MDIASAIWIAYLHGSSGFTM